MANKVMYKALNDRARAEAVTFAYNCIERLSGSKSVILGKDELKCVNEFADFLTEIAVDCVELKIARSKKDV